MRSKLEMLTEKIDCKDRGHTGDGFPLCLVNDRDCPYAQTERYVSTVMGSFYPCRYANVFDSFHNTEIKRDGLSKR
jgi:hypothetical protein